MMLIFYFFVIMFMTFIGLSWHEVLIFLGFGVMIWLPIGYSSVNDWNSTFFFSFDLLSWTMVGLSVWVGMLMLLASVNSSFMFKGKIFKITVLLLIVFLICTFFVQNYIYFYIFFEASMIPIFLLIMGWGYQPERLQAGIYLLFYTLFGSLPLLVFLVLMFLKSGSFWMKMGFCSEFLSLFWGVLSLSGFMIKLPMFFFHLWLPSAHVEAPVSGSMMLAGVLLKLGSYGLFRFGLFLKNFILKVSWFYCSVGLLGAIYIGLICLRQMDIKALIAYSSVAHMGLMLAGFMSFISWGWEGSLVMMIGHGLCSSGLFCLANMGYERLKSRSLMVNKGLFLWFPGMSLWWFLLSVCNMSSPPSLNLFGEIVLFMSMIIWFKGLFLILIIGSFVGGAYSIYMYSLSQHGESLIVKPVKGSGLNELLLSFLHWIPLNFLILKSDLVIFWL